jgi:hypothetical protein
LLPVKYAVYVNNDSLFFWCLGQLGSPNLSHAQNQASHTKRLSQQFSKKLPLLFFLDLYDAIVSCLFFRMIEMIAERKELMSLPLVRQRPTQPNHLNPIHPNLSQSI